MKKRLIFPLISIGTMIVPFVVTSCSKNQASFFSSESVLIKAIETGDIILKININSNSNQKIKITDLDNLKLSWSIKNNIANDPNQSDYKDSLEKAIDENDINYFDFEIPKLNQDNIARIILKINDSDAYVSFQNIQTEDEKKLGEIGKIQNLNEQEIIDLIDKKLNDDKNFVTNLHVFLKQLIIDKIDKTSSNDFSKWWEQNKSHVSSELKFWFFNNYIFFNKDYNNLYINEISAILNSDMKSINFNFKISTDKNSTLTYSLKKSLKLYFKNN